MTLQPDPVKPGDLRLRKRDVAVGFVVALVCTGLAVLLVAGVIALGAMPEISSSAAALGIPAALVASMIVCVRKGRRAWALGVGLFLVTTVVAAGLFVWWLSTLSWC